MHSRTHRVKTQFCITQSPSHFVSLQETEHRQQLMHILQQTMQLLRTQKTERQQASFVTYCLWIRTCSTDFGHIQIPDSWKSMPHISSYRDGAKSPTANIREFAWKKASISVQKKKKKSNSAQGPFLKVIYSTFITKRMSIFIISGKLHLNPDNIHF